MSGSLDGRVVIITGAAGGIGWGLAHAFAAAGAFVYATGRRRSALDEMVAAAEHPERMRVIECDVTDRDAIAAVIATAVDEGGRLDTFVHNAVDGSSSTAMRVETVTEADWRPQADVSVRASFDCAQLAFEPLRASRGSLIFFTSINALVGGATLPLYATVKAMQRALVKSLAREWGPSGVRVNSVSPFARTRALERFFAADPERERRLVAQTPLGWIGDPRADIGPAVVFLASDAARYITGQTLTVDGGTFTGL